jgi:ubiquinone/menaquinone biosynthesis C-methylase UbiE
LCHGEIHLGQAKARSAASGTTLGSITKGDARCLSAQSNSADAVLLLGERSDRLMALREARRILKPKGVLIAAAISRFASLIDGLARGFFRDSDFRKIVARDLATGQHRNPTNQTAHFTTAYFHRPEELAAEVRECRPMMFEPARYVSAKLRLTRTVTEPASTRTPPGVPGLTNQAITLKTTARRILVG